MVTAASKTVIKWMEPASFLVVKKDTLVKRVLSDALDSANPTLATDSLVRVTQKAVKVVITGLSAVLLVHKTATTINAML